MCVCVFNFVFVSTGHGEGKKYIYIYTGIYKSALGETLFNTFLPPLPPPRVGLATPFPSHVPRPASLLEVLWTDQLQLPPPAPPKEGSVCHRRF